MVSFLSTRIIAAIVTVFLVLTAVFFVIRIKGDPTSLLLPFNYTPQQKLALQKEIGVDKPILQQYAIFMGKAVRGDLGQSHRWHTNAFGMVADRMPATLKLALLAFAFSIFVSVPLGTLAAARRGSIADSVVGVITTTGQAIPNFVLAVLLVWLFSVKLRWLPVGNIGGLNHYILPAITLAAFPIASQTRIVRSAVADTLSEDYIRTAHAKGLSGLVVQRRHALRNAMVPILTILGIQWSYFIGGSVIVEWIFAWPGVGRLMADAITARDYTVVQAGVVVLTTLVVATNVITDLLYMVVDPRLRSGKAA